MLFGVSEQTGKAVWQSQTGVPLEDGDDAAAGGYRGVAPAIAGDLLVIASGQDVIGYRPVESAPEPATSVRRATVRPGPIDGTTDAVSFQATTSHTGRPAGAALPRHLHLAWRRQFPGQVGYPLVAGGRVFATAQDETTGVAAITAFSLRTGRRLWGPGALPDADRGYINAAYDDGRVVVVGGAGDVAAFRSRDGHPLWAIRGPGSVWRTPPVAAGGRLFLYFEGNGGILAAINDRTGKPLWAFEDFANGGQGVPIVHRKTVYYAYSCDLVALSVVTGQPRWVRNRSCDGSGGPTPALYRRRLYVTDPTFFNRIVATRSGHVVRGYSASTTPALDGNTGFFLNGSVLRAENLGSGAIAWTFRGDGQLTSTPIVAGGRVFIGSASGMLYGLSERTGRIVWEDEQPQPLLSSRQLPIRSLVGLNAGDGALAVPATNVLSVYR
jgi:outer membrane protein assembly factor BamB